MDGGILGGTGIIGGAVTVASVGHPGRVALRPGQAGATSETLSIQNDLFLYQGSAFQWVLNSDRSTAGGLSSL